MWPFRPGKECSHPPREKWEKSQVLESGRASVCERGPWMGEGLGQPNPPSNGKQFLGQYVQD